ncbi:MAG TPA: PAS domain-containing protein, partial [Spirochaetota bacterium]|nr:PAS domain-containing protein [Spirochaetota bacterium]
MHSIHEILSVRFGIYSATVNRSLELDLSDSDLLGYLGAPRPDGPVQLLDLFPELVGLEADIAAVQNGESDGFCVPTVNRVPERDIFFDLHLFIYRPAEGTALLVVRDATAEGISLRKVQQRRNDLLLKNQELVQREEFVRTLLDTMPNPVYYTDPDSMFLGCNTSFAAFLGKERDDIIGRRVMELLPPGAAAAFMGLGAG